MSTPRSAEPRRPRVAFLSDFGRADGSVGVVHLVVTGICPAATVVDLTHEVPPYDVVGAALTLERAAPWLPAVTLAVVDPGVGTARRPLAVTTTAGHVLIGPDNGLLLPAARALGGVTSAVTLDDPVWHGTRPVADAGDVFAPVAGWVASGEDVGQMGGGVEVSSLVDLPAAPDLLPADGDRGVHSRVRWVDRFGNVQLDVRALPPGWAGVSIDGVPAPTAGTYDDIPEGDIGLVVDAHGWLSVAARRASAAERLGLVVGRGVVLVPL